MDGEPALAMTVARRCRWVNIKGDWYQTDSVVQFEPPAFDFMGRFTGPHGDASVGI
jgi:hypothetical protein